LQLPTKITHKALGMRINSLAATNNFKVIHYKIINNTILELKINEREDKLFLKGGIHYDGLYKSAALINITRKQFLTNNDIVSFDLILGDKVRYDFDYYIDKGFYWSVGLKSRFNSFETNVFLDVISEIPPAVSNLNMINLKVADLTNEFYIQTLFRKDMAFGLGIEHKLLDIKTPTILDVNNNDTVFERTNFLSLSSFLTFDNLDDRYYPSKGFYFDGKFNLYLHSSDRGRDFVSFSVAKARMGFAQTLTEKLSLSVFSEGGIRIGNNTTNSLDFVLGGYGNNFINNYTSFYGYDYLSLPGDSYVKGTINLDYELFENHHLLFSANYANIDDGLFKDQDWLSWPAYSGYAVGYGFETFLGPLEVKYSWSPEGDSDKWFFNVGYWF
jgi:NTE family protein